jgi:hypothetical protein
MLAYVLALVIGLGSLAIFLAAFFLPEVHRKEDFIWSGVGLFYALVLWVCAGRITGGVLLGQMASVALLGWFGWQTLTLRREMTLPEHRTPISPEVQDKIKSFSLPDLGQKLQQQMTSLLKKKQPETQKLQTAPTTVKPAKEKKTAPTESTATVEVAPPKVTETSTFAPASETTADVTDSSNSVTIIDSRNTPTESTQVDEPAAASAEISESPELIRPNPPAAELVEAAQASAPSEVLESNADTATPIAEIAPEVELAPPAEPPGDGDPTMRQNPPEVDIAIEGIPINPEHPPKLS